MDQIQICHLKKYCSSLPILLIYPTLYWEFLELLNAPLPGCGALALCTETHNWSITVGTIPVRQVRMVVCRMRYCMVNMLSHLGKRKAILGSLLLNESGISNLLPTRGKTGHG